MTEINWAIITPLIILQAILIIMALVNCIKQEKTNGPKWMWFLIIICISIFGPILYFILGQKKE
ncbi:PLD nuclease N-terminal domain-containing protein [Robertmurraya kyonggiensis]|uniref:PLDc_N domain-containing protein n=1 Tax=Robertmurraya kyonggiensis TaxID=1037680 RepID=A0A4U1CZ14_9BACI|nr:PLD nuclease N-terminal domain-containing protein [Robertmurraya kyonggiensis]TKC15275.1 PLDc_N domain-containing protein [Robertmurraya kyonggiensis]